jgi:hypothetical protein
VSLDQLRTGCVIRFPYLWVREAERGETEGRKPRPVAVGVRIARPKGEDVLVLFPITSQPPSSDRFAAEIPEIIPVTHSGKSCIDKMPACLRQTKWSRPFGRKAIGFALRLRGASSSIGQRQTYAPFTRTRTQAVPAAAAPTTARRVVRRATPR